jgi:uncharacterized membrane protein YedE/YeeE
MIVTIAALVAGCLFGVGLIAAEMVNPARVQGFLDVAGTWDPTLLFVMVGALLVASIGYRLVFARAAPLFAQVFSVPVKQVIDRRLIGGAMLFGAGWGLAGFCPGPAMVGLATFSSDVLLFVASMLAGMWLFAYFE